MPSPNCPLSFALQQYVLFSSKYRTQGKYKGGYEIQLEFYQANVAGMGSPVVAITYDLDNCEAVKANCTNSRKVTSVYGDPKSINVRDIHSIVFDLTDKQGYINLVFDVTEIVFFTKHWHAVFEDSSNIVRATGLIGKIYDDKDANKSMVHNEWLYQELDGYPDNVWHRNKLPYSPPAGFESPSKAK